MKKILIIINTIILSFTLFSCGKNKDEILYKEKIIEKVHSVDFKNGFPRGYYDMGEPIITAKRKILNILDPSSMDIHNCDYHVGSIVEKKVIAGYYSSDMVNNIFELSKELNLSVFSEPGFAINGISRSFFQLYELNIYHPDVFDLNDYNINIYSFDDGIPLEYKNEILGFVVNYYRIKFDSGREIVSIGHCFGNIIDDNFYPDVINDTEIEPLNYGRFIYQESEYSNVVHYYLFRQNVIVEEYGLEFYTDLLVYVESSGRDYLTEEKELFEYLKGALRDDSPTKEFELYTYYYYDFQKLINILVK